MTPSPTPPKQLPKQNTAQSDQQNTVDISEEIVTTIKGLKDGLKTYPIRQMVQQAEKFGPYLKNQRLETNQVRKFLDAINRLKIKLVPNIDNPDQDGEIVRLFREIEPEIVLLKPKLAYAAARQPAAKPLSKVMSVAIDNVKTLEDFYRLVQFIESIIAYHKAEGGK